MMSDETVESILNSHSERLALAFNLIQRPIPSRIQIVKNLRICGDCRKFFLFCHLCRISYKENVFSLTIYFYYRCCNQTN